MSLTAEPWIGSYRLFGRQLLKIGTESFDAANSRILSDVIVQLQIGVATPPINVLLIDIALSSIPRVILNFQKFWKWSLSRS